jgi:hypothetical protein
MGYIVLDPTDGPIKTSFTLAPRPKKLKGVTLGVIDNGKKNSDYLLKGILERLQAEEGLAGHVTIRKPSVSHGLPADQARILAEQCQVVIAGIGD